VKKKYTDEWIHQKSKVKSPRNSKTKESSIIIYRH